MRGIPLVVATLLFAQLANGQNAPAITRVQIANGSFNTASPTVTLNVTASGTPTAYRASESKDFTGAQWHSFSATPSFTLSSTPGFKTVFVQVGRSATLPSLSTTKPTTDVRISAPGDYVIAPTVFSNVMADSIILGLPDLKSTVDMPASVHDNSAFDFWVSVSNAGQINPSSEVIQLYNSFVTNSIVFDRFEVPFGVGKLVGDGCKVTDVSTIECTPAPIAPDGGVGVHVFAHVVRAVPAGQTSIRFTLRTRITGVRESNTTNNWRDTPLTIVK